MTEYEYQLGKQASAKEIEVYLQRAMDERRALGCDEVLCFLFGVVVAMKERETKPPLLSLQPDGTIERVLE